MDEQRKNPYRRPPPTPEIGRKPARKPSVVEPQSSQVAPKPTNPGRKPPHKPSVVEPQPSVVGGRRGLRQLPHDLRDLADGKVDRLRGPSRARSAFDDDREGAVIPGVRNMEARAVYDARVAALRTALAAGHEVELVEGLREAQQLALWRARNVTDFRAFAESVVGVPAGTSEALVNGGIDPSNHEQPLAPQAIALLIRVEAALLQRPPGGRVRLRQDAGGLQLELSVPVQDVPRTVETLSDVGRAVSALRRFLRPDASATHDSPDTPRKPTRGSETGWRSGPGRERPHDSPRRGPHFHGRTERDQHPPKRRKP
jgi:hypothetical protein